MSKNTVKTQYGIVFPQVQVLPRPAQERVEQFYDRVTPMFPSPALAETAIFKILGRPGIVAERLSDHRKPRRYLLGTVVVAEILAYVPGPAKNEAED